MNHTHRNHLLKACLLALFSILFTACETRFPVCINEICGKDSDGNEWVELYNNSDQDVSLAGMYLVKMDEDGVDRLICRFKSEVIPAKGYLMVKKMLDDMDEAGKKAKTRLSSRKELGIELLDKNDEIRDAFYRDDEVGEHQHPKGGSYARQPDGGQVWVILQVATPEAPNEGDTYDVEMMDES